MKDIEFTTSTGRMLVILGMMLFLSSTGLFFEHVTPMEVFRIMSGVISTLALVMFFRVK